jgi:TRAP-type C4-dicarboxylate transport system permease small subunit
MHQHTDRKNARGQDPPGVLTGLNGASMRVFKIFDQSAQKAGRIIERTAFVLFIIMTLIVWTQIFYRYFLKDGIIWAEEISKYLMVWMAMLSAVLVFKDNGHIAIQFFSKRIQSRWLLGGLQLLGTALFVMLIVVGWDYALFGKRFISPASGLRRFWPYLAIPVTGALLLFFNLFHIVTLFRNSSSRAHKKDHFDPCEMPISKERN